MVAHSLKPWKHLNDECKFYLCHQYYIQWLHCIIRILKANFEKATESLPSCGISSEQILKAIFRFSFFFHHNPSTLQLKEKGSALRSYIWSKALENNSDF